MKRPFRALFAPGVLIPVGFAVAAFLLRAQRIELMEFKHDEAVAWLRGRAFVAGEAFPRVGLMSSRGVPNFPLFVYVAGVLQALCGSPQRIALAIALLNSAAVALAFAGARRLFGLRTAVLTAFFFTFSPAAIFLSRKIWAQDLLALWMCALFLLLARRLASRHRADRPGAFLLGLLACTAPQIHLSALFPILASAATACTATAVELQSVRGERRSPLYRVSWRPLLLGVAVGTLPALPWVGRFALEGPGRFLAASADAAGGEARWRLKEIVFYFVRQPADSGFPLYLGEYYRPFLESQPPYAWVRYLLSALVVAGGVLCAWRTARGRPASRRRFAAPAAVAAIGLAGLALTRLPLVPSYFIAFYPLPFLFAALAVDQAWGLLERRCGGRVAAALVIVGLVGIGASQAVYVHAFLNRIQANGGARGDYGPAWRETVQAARWIAQRASSTEELELLDISVLAALVAEGGAGPVGGDAWGSDREAAGLQPTPSRLLLVSCLRHPAFAPAPPATVHEVNRAWYGVEAPREQARELASRYPPHPRTPAQIREAAAAGRLAIELLRSGAERVQGVAALPAAPSAREPSSPWRLQKPLRHRARGDVVRKPRPREALPKQTKGLPGSAHVPPQKLLATTPNAAPAARRIRPNG